MGTWALVVDVAAATAVGLLMIVLGWAALERGRVHGIWAAQRSELEQHAQPGIGSWRTERALLRLFRFAHRTRRIHLTVTAVAGCV